MQPHPASYHFALTGHPLGHSFSPVIHNAALQASGLGGSYVLRPVSPDQVPGGLEVLVNELRDGTLDGLNVTIPHKQAILRLCDRLTSTAQAIGAANLIFLSDGLIWGENSDADGFLASLEILGDRWPAQARHASVLGAGGSARAVIYALAKAGWQVHVTARRPEQAGQLVNDIASSLPQAAFTVSSMTRQDFKRISASDLIVNTTPLGMFPNLDGCPWPEDVPISARSVIYDLVYNPRQTRLLKMASKVGAVPVGGIAMLVEQAAIAFERWTGQPAPRKAMYDSVE